MTIKIKLTRAVNLTHYGVPAGTVVTLDMDGEYLPICLSSEIYENNSRTPPEAKKAQAVAARCYALAHAVNGNVIDDTANYQAFSWKDLSSIPNCVRACAETAGQVLYHDDRLITAWYSNSNGGHTKSSRQAWGGVTAWTVSQPDPWDILGREKWGQVSASHGVGMSQIGAAYGAFAGAPYDGILAFYYPNTEIRWNYGEVGAMTGLQAMASYAVSKIGCGYIMGATGWTCSLARRQQQAAQYPAYADKILGIGAKWDGIQCFDCAQLVRLAVGAAGATLVSGATSQWNQSGAWESRGDIATLPEGPCVLYRWANGAMQHTGISLGFGWTVDARGTAEGVVHSRIDSFGWTHWAIPVLGNKTGGGVSDMEVPYTAKVKTKTGKGVNLWSDSGKVRVVAAVPEGAVVTVIGIPDGVGFALAEYGGAKGVIDTQYLVQAESQSAQAESDPCDDMITVSVEEMHDMRQDVAALLYKLDAALGGNG